MDKRTDRFAITISRSACINTLTSDNKVKVMQTLCVSWGQTVVFQKNTDPKQAERRNLFLLGVINTAVDGANIAILQYS